MKRARIGLVLGGGGARGLAHIGVIKRLLEYDVPIDVLTGASMGAIIGAAYALTKNIHFIETTIRKFISSAEFRSVKSRALNIKDRNKENLFHFISKVVKRRIIINLAANRLSLIQDKFLTNAISQLLPEESIENLSLPFACTALDLVSGKEVVFRRGNVRKAVQASAAIPGFLPPVSADGRRLVDGAVINNFPIDVAKSLGADLTIVCSVSPELEEESAVNNVIDVFIRAHHAAVARLNEILLGKGDVVLKPALGNIDWTEFEQIDFLIKQGEAVVEHQIDQIKKKIAKANGFWMQVKRTVSAK